MSLGGYAFFVLFAATQVAMYLGLRRKWTTRSQIAVIGLPLGMVFAGIMAALNGNSLAQIMFVALLMGGLIGGSTLAMATFFDNNENQTT